MGTQQENGKAGKQDQLKKRVATEELINGPGWPGHLVVIVQAGNNRNSVVGPGVIRWMVLVVSLGQGSVRVLWPQELDLRTLSQVYGLKKISPKTRFSLTPNAGICVIWVFSNSQQ